MVQPHDLSEAAANTLLGSALTRPAHAFDLLRRPEVSYDSLSRVAKVGAAEWMSGEQADERLREQVQLQVEVLAKYTGYIDRQQDEIERQRRHEETKLPADFDYGQVRGLSTEVSQKLARVRPATIGQAARVPGVTPAAVSLLLVYLKKRSLQDRALSA